MHQNHPQFHRLLLPSGKRTYLFNNFAVITLQVSSTILQTVDLPNPNKEARMRYSIFVASFHIITATTEIGYLIFALENVPIVVAACV